MPLNKDKRPDSVVKVQVPVPLCTPANWRFLVMAQPFRFRSIVPDPIGGTTEEEATVLPVRSCAFVCLVALSWRQITACADWDPWTSMQQQLTHSRSISSSTGMAVTLCTHTFYNNFD